ncbi:MAG: DUF748 domain-containing protein [Betaproteobacteria bacterium]|nr:DUF748 domain-containing protein [Betaproteobacteria bacterium]
MSLIRKLGLGFVGVVILLAALSYFVLPGLILSRAEQKVGEITHRHLTLQNVEINPFALSLTLRGLRLYEPDGYTVFASFDEMQAKISVRSLIHLAPVVRELRLVRPSLHLVLLSPHQYNFDDLLQRVLQPPATPSSGPARFAVHNIQIEGGVVTFDDRPRKISHVITDLKLNIPFISTLPSQEDIFVEPVLRARVDGTDLQFKAKGLPFAVQPEAQMHLDVEGMDLPRYLDYLPFRLPFNLAQGQVTLHLDANVQTHAKQPMTVGLEGQFQFNAVKASMGKGGQGLTLMIDNSTIDLRGASLSLGDQVLAVDKLDLSIPTARIEDKRQPRPVITTLSALLLVLQDISTAPGKSGAMDFVTQINAKGQAHLSGAIGLAPVQALLDVGVKKLDLLPLQSYLTSRVNFSLSRGTLSTQGNLKIASTAAGAVKGGFQGRVSLDDVATVDRTGADDLVHWKSLVVDGIDVRVTPFSLAIKQIALSDFFAKVSINPDGRVNLQNLIRTDLPNPATDDSASTGSAVFPVKISQVSLERGAVHFSDNYIKPHYTADLGALRGVITGLSSDAATAASIDLRGQVNDAPLSIAGQVNPLRGNLFLDLHASVNDMELAPLSPYSGKYMGYDIEKGKFSFDVNYHVLNHTLTGQNHLVLNQLTFGNKVDSPDATRLPVELAIALLKDRNGTIDVNLPVEGSLNDPQFSMGALILKMVFNLIAKAVISPFELIGSFFENSVSASSMAFDPGRDTLNPANAAQLQSLARALKERPALKLDIAGRADRAVDAEGMLHDSIDQPMSANTTVTDDDLIALANRRAEVIQDWLVRNGQVARERLFIVEGTAGEAQSSKQLSPARVDFFLK